MEIINGLLRIKQIRENSREVDMRRARTQLEQASEQMRLAAERQLTRDRERMEKERALYDDVCSRVVLLRDLDEVRYQIDLMKVQAKEDVDAVNDAQERKKQRREEFSEANSAWMLSVQATQKFADLSREQERDIREMAERSEDLELEEFTCRVSEEENSDDMETEQ